MPKDKTGKRKRGKPKWMDTISARPPSGRAAAAKSREKTREVMPAGRTAGFVSGKGLTKIGVNKRIALKHLKSQVEAEKASGTDSQFQHTLFHGMARYHRAGMGDAVTDSLLEQGSASLAHGVEQQVAFRAARTMATLAGLPAPGLRASGRSRNHILADSSIASIAHMAMSNYTPGSDIHQAALQQFFTAITNSGPKGAEHLQDFLAAHHEIAHGARPDDGITRLHNLIDTIAVSPNNMVIADDARNTNQGARFDPVMDTRGRLDAASQAIMNAVIRLQEVDLISPDMRQAVLSMARRTVDRMYETSNSARPAIQEDLLDGFLRRRPTGAGPAATEEKKADSDDDTEEDDWADVPVGDDETGVSAMDARFDFSSLSAGPAAGPDPDVRFDFGSLSGGPSAGPGPDVPMHFGGPSGGPAPPPFRFDLGPPSGGPAPPPFRFDLGPPSGSPAPPPFRFDLGPPSGGPAPPWSFDPSSFGPAPHGTGTAPPGPSPAPYGTGTGASPGPSGSGFGPWPSGWGPGPSGQGPSGFPSG